MLNTPKIKPVITSRCCASVGGVELVEIGLFKWRNMRSNAVLENRLADSPTSGGNSMVVRRFLLFGSVVLISLAPFVYTFDAPNTLSQVCICWMGTVKTIDGYLVILLPFRMDVFVFVER
jgi:hypothetical protein